MKPIVWLVLLAGAAYLVRRLRPIQVVYRITAADPNRVPVEVVSVPVDWDAWYMASTKWN